MLLYDSSILHDCLVEAAYLPIYSYVDSISSKIIGLTCAVIIQLMRVSASFNKYSRERKQPVSKPVNNHDRPAFFGYGPNTMGLYMKKTK